MFNKSLATMIATGAILLSAGAANATVATYTSQSAYTSFGSGGTIGVADNVDWGVFSQAQGNVTVNNSTVNNGATLTTGVQLEQVTAYNGSGNGFTVYTNGQLGGAPNTRWDGNFANGINVLSTGSTSITLSFVAAVTGFGIDAQTSNLGAYGFTINAYSGGTNGTGGTLITSVSNSGTSTGRNSNASQGTAAFAGITSTAGDISYVTITATGANTAAGFAIDTSLVYHTDRTQGGSGPATTPEPGTIALLGAGLVGLGLARRRRKTV